MLTHSQKKYLFAIYKLGQNGRPVKSADVAKIVGVSKASTVKMTQKLTEEGYIVKELEDEYIVLPVGKRTEEVNEVISLSETAGFIYIHADQAEDIEGLAQMVGNEYGIEASEVYEDVKNVVKTFREKGILL